MDDQSRDIFICHASEDKEEIVRPMVEAFEQADITCWFDESEIIWGDSITQKVNKGLTISRYVLVVLSEASVNKKWPQRELNAVLNLEASSGEIKILPLIVGSEQEQAQILAQYPLLNDKRYLPWDGNLRKITEALLARLKKDVVVESQSSNKNIGLRIPLPKIKQKFNQRDKDIFLRESFAEVRTYFKNGLTELEKSYQEVQTDCVEVHDFKFICTIYVRGESSSRCKIWLGGFGPSDSIAYQTGQFQIDSDNSYGEILTIADDTQHMGFNPLNIGFYGHFNAGDGLLNQGQAAEYLWRRFTDNLGQ